MLVRKQRFQVGARLVALLSRCYSAAGLLTRSRVLDVTGKIGLDTGEGYLTAVHWHLTVEEGIHYSSNQSLLWSRGT